MNKIFIKIKTLLLRFFLKNFTFLLMPKNQRSILYWREYFFNVVFFIMLLISGVIIIYSTIRQIMGHNYGFLFLSLSIFVIGNIIFFIRKIPFYVRSFIGCTIFYFVGLLVFYKIGPVADGLFWFFLFSIFNASFNGVRGVIYSNIVIALTVIFFIFAIPRYDFNWIAINKYFYGSNGWNLTGTNLFFLNFISSASVLFFMNNLERVIIKNADSRNAIIFGLASLTEYRDNDTGKHLERISKYSVLLAEELKKTKKYKSYITDNYLEDLEISSILHDIGKVGVEDKILLKKGKLTNKEFDKIKMHPVIGYKVIESINKKMKDKNYLKLASQIILYHHEKYNGTGYPKGLAGEEIPLSARIVALVDVYDALVSERVYKKAFTHEESVKIIINEKGSHFDPDLVDVFKKVHKKFHAIS